MNYFIVLSPGNFNGWGYYIYGQSAQFNIYSKLPSSKIEVENSKRVSQKNTSTLSI
jgi:hypothetical protein